MNYLSRILIVFAVILILFAVAYDYHKTSGNQDSIRAELVAKGLPTPAFANTEELKRILNL